MGRGPNLQIHHPNQAAAKRLERNFRRWMKRTGLAAKLRTAITSLVGDGEVFAVTANNPAVRNAVHLDVKLLEADYCTDLTGEQSETFDDGIEYDDNGYPIAYNFLEHHPGDNFGQSIYGRPKRVVADQVIHYYRVDRPGQRRGVPWVAPALPLFALMRRYTLAVTMAAETAATFAGVMYADGNQVAPDEEVDPMDSIEFEMRSMPTLPIGWKLGQLKAEQPTTTYQMFRDALLCEISRCLHMPFNNGDQEASFLKQPKVAKTRRPWDTHTLKLCRVNRGNSTQKTGDIETMTKNPGQDRSELNTSNSDDTEPDVTDFPQDVAAAWANVVLDLYEQGVRNSDSGKPKQEPRQKRRKAG
ncbi:phage portal protein [Bremerella cremea]|uniref:phage portal protein n=1 Tax=Bremerella cremea TaxID=1031537 RepID=UPI001314059B|nr:phage portal protein [Bremerella cremea]